MPVYIKNVVGHKLGDLLNSYLQKVTRRTTRRHVENKENINGESTSAKQCCNCVFPPRKSRLVLDNIRGKAQPMPSLF